MLAALVVLHLTSSTWRAQDWGVLAATTLAEYRSRYFPVPFAGATAGGDIELYAVRYQTSEARSESSSSEASGGGGLLSGLVAIPRSGPKKGLVLYFHSTTSERDEVPSRFRPAGGPTETALILAAFCADGYAVIAPDYAGLGDDRSKVHPYAIASVNCQSGIAMIDIARQIAPTLANRPLFITGYSEGGAVAMQAARNLSGRGSSSIRACAPISGAYDLSDTEARAMISHQSNAKWLAARFFLVGYLGYALSKSDPSITLDQLFVPSFASYVRSTFERNLTDLQIIERLVKKGLQVGALTSIQRALQPELVRAIEAHDLRNPVVARLADEDCYDWAPSSPLRMIALENDYLVPVENAKRARDAMRARGVGSDMADLVSVDEKGFDHISFLPRGLQLVLDFFDSKQSPR
jgi:pimeloyl-ACP methyl ester carboxylesterase